MAYPQLNKHFYLYTDASDKSIGACLTQLCEETKTEKPIDFISHKLGNTQSRWSTIEKEAYAIHYALHELDHYLYGAKFHYALHELDHYLYGAKFHYALQELDHYLYDAKFTMRCDHAPLAIF